MTRSHLQSSSFFLGRSQFLPTEKTVRLGELNVESVCTRFKLEGPMRKKKRKKLHGTVEKVIKPIIPGEPEKAQIGIEKADELYREIRIENVLTDEHGEEVRLKRGAEVEVVVEADSDATMKKPD
jgi:hypothetical protein